MAQLLLSLGLLGTVLCAASAKLDQAPVVRAAQGDAVTLTCSCQPCNFTDFLSMWDFYSGDRGAERPVQVALRPSSKARAEDAGSRFPITHHRHSQSSLVIRDLQINDTGTYVCTVITRAPPPTLTLVGPGTRLEVYAAPHIWLSSATNADRTSLVTCTASDFYPQTLGVALTATCGEYGVLDDNASLVVTSAGTFNLTQRAWVDAAGCHNGTAVTCSVKQLTETRRTLWIPGTRQRGPEALFYARMLIAGLVILWLILLVLLRSRNFSSETARSAFAVSGVPGARRRRGTGDGPEGAAPSQPPESGSAQAQAQTRGVRPPAHAV